MCGRYSTTLDIPKIEEVFAAHFDGNFSPHYKATPGQFLPIITNEHPNAVQLFRWGLLPDWAKEENVGYKMINARKEDITEKVSFKKPIQKQRCLVLANGFYEWRKNDTKSKTPFFIHPTDQTLFAMAGIWNRWLNKNTGEEIETYSIITMEANTFMQKLHDRMPAILPIDKALQWIETKKPVQEALQLLQPYPSSRLEAFEVSKEVNKANLNTPSLIQPVGEILTPVLEE